MYDNMDLLMYKNQSLATIPSSQPLHARRFSQGSPYVPQISKSSLTRQSAGDIYNIASALQKQQQQRTVMPVHRQQSLPTTALRRDSIDSCNGQVDQPSRYKTEMCRPFEETGHCRYGAKCQFAHGMHEMRNMNRHPKYKTELCRTFHSTGFCSYGQRCNFIHNDDERRSSLSSQQMPSTTNVFLDRQNRPQRPNALILPTLPLTSTSDSPASSVNGDSPLESPGYLNDEHEVFAFRLSPTPSSGSNSSITSSNSFPSPPLTPHLEQRETYPLYSPLDVGLAFSLFNHLTLS